MNLDEGREEDRTVKVFHLEVVADTHFRGGLPINGSVYFGERSAGCRKKRKAVAALVCLVTSRRKELRKS